MCGIAGSFGETDRHTLPLMLNRLIHRGPDDAGEEHGPGFSLGARRLSIMDPALGRQPVGNEKASVWAVQNGEIYNFAELRRQLCARGHRLVTRCDTEVLPHLYEEHGLDLACHLDGMFAVAVWDVARQLGLLIRDRVGKKGLYYCQRGTSLYFASEIKALLQIPGFEPRLNLQAVHHYLSLKHVPHPLTSFEGIMALPPAHTLVFRPGLAPRLQRYWEIPLEKDAALGELPEEELVEMLLGLLRNGVERRLQADVPVGFFLSGGLDSSLSLALAAEMNARPIKTFTLNYRNDSGHAGKQQDGYWARWLARAYGTEHHEEEIDWRDFPAQLHAALRAFDEPFSGVISTFFLARRIGRHVKVALSGDGADELLGSYLSHRLAFPLANLDAFQDSGDSSLLRPFEHDLDYLKRLAAPADWMWRSKLFVFSEAEKRRLLACDAASLESSAALLRRAFAGLEGNDPLNRVLKAEFRTLFPDQVLTFVDRLAMAHSLEVRCPFLDTEVVNFAARLPGHWKIRQGETKYLLKRAALRYLPAEMVFRRKEGFVMPLNAWLHDHLEDYVRQTLSVTALESHGLFRPTQVQSLVDAFYAGRSELANKILTLLSFQEWFDQYRPSVRGQVVVA